MATVADRAKPATRTGKVRVAVVDDHEVVRAGITMFLAMSDDIELCGEATTLDEAVELARTSQPDVVLMDLRLDDGTDGVTATRAVLAARPQARVIILTAHGNQDTMLSALAAGAAGFLTKATRREELLVAIRSVAAGHSLLDTDLFGDVLDRARRGVRFTDARLATLSSRELEILDLLALGRTNRDIADALHLSEKTVKNHVTHVLAKLGVTRRSQATAYLNRHATRL